MASSIVSRVLEGIFGFGKKVELVINFDEQQNLNTKKFRNTGWHQKLASLNIVNNGKDTAEKCKVEITVLDRPGNPDHLQDEYDLSWGSTYSKSIESGSTDIQGNENKKLNVLFTHEGKEGGWIATSEALSNVDEENASYLPPGKYEFELKLNSKNTDDQTKKIIASIPENWRQLDVEITDTE